MSHKINITVDGQSYSYFAGITLQNVSRDFQKDYPHAIILARVNGKLMELTSTLESDCNVSFITTDTQTGWKTYQRTCRMVMIKAFEDVFGRENAPKVFVMYSIGKALYCELDTEEEPTEELIAQVRQKMIEIVEDKIPFVRRTVPMREALDIFREYGAMDKVDLFYYRRSTSVSFYMLDETIDYMYGYMAPDTSYVKYFDLVKYNKGFALMMPDEKHPEVLEKVKPAKKLAKVFQQSRHWSRLLDVRTIADLNRVICNNQFSDLVLVQEALMEKIIGNIAGEIVDRNRRVVLIAGPSSSGKTTFSHRLAVQMKALGLKPQPLAVDNYFVDREKTPLGEDGKYDFECIEAIDLKRLNDDITGLIAGDEVSIPVFNFVTGKREEAGIRKQLSSNSVLIIEGIHSLNDRMTYSLGDESKYKIYISALTQLNIDNHNRLPTTDVRLIRRMCRDAVHRGANAAKTIDMWSSVRRGEEKNIFPFQEKSDFMFNSALIYEMAVLKQIVEPLLFKVRPDESAYDESKRLLKLMNYLLGASDDAVPINSIIREFIGGSCFDVG